MKPNKLSSGFNVMWESSRIMLPQHKEGIFRQSKQLQKQIKPELTEEEQAEMFGRLKEAKMKNFPVTITVFGEYENRRITGIVTGLDPRLHLIKFEANNDWQLIEFINVIGVD